MTWYPGQSIVERRKREYMDTHPNIRARSVACPSLSSDNSDSGGRQLIETSEPFLNDRFHAREPLLLP